VTSRDLPEWESQKPNRIDSANNPSVNASLNPITSSQLYYLESKGKQQADYTPLEKTKDIKNKRALRAKRHEG
jgi:hypothetical protein